MNHWLLFFHDLLANQYQYSIVNTKAHAQIMMILLWSGGCNIEGEDESWDFGTGAGFYVNATQEPWKTNYRMYSYVTEEVCVLYMLQSLVSY